MLYNTLKTRVFDKNNKPGSKERKAVIDFLFDNLDDYGDPKYQISQAVAYALGETCSLGGFVLVSYCKKEHGNDKDNPAKYNYSLADNDGYESSSDSEISGAVVINKTGMADYIPGNILVYIATDRKCRGRGIGKELLRNTITLAEGDIALHVEPRNPAKRLYEKMGFTNKYIEMRYKKND